MNKKPIYFLSAIFFFTFLSSYVVAGMINFHQSNPFLAAFWFGGFVLFTFNVGYMLVCSIVARFGKENLLKEKKLTALPKTAITYVVRNEDYAVLLENLGVSFANNYDENIDLWLLSNSELEDVIEKEHQVVEKLCERFGAGRIGYFQTKNNPLRRKHVCIQEWLHANPQYSYLVVCDADSLLPSGSVAKLLSKAEHPDNICIVHFQSHINIIKGKTYFTNFLGHGQDFCQRIYARTNQIIFDRGLSYGSGCLIRCKEFGEINVPHWVLSHDIWDTVFLEEKKYKLAFCYDVVTYGRFPNNYIDYMSRNQRWIKGTLESFGIVLSRKIPLGTRFMTLYPIYTYCVQPLFLLWIISGFFSNLKVWTPLLVTQRYAFLGASLIDMEMSSHLFITLGILKLHRFVKCKGIREMGLVFVDLLSSLLLCLNNLVFDTIAVLSWVATRKKGMKWIAMPKRINGDIYLIPIVKKLWPSTFLGIIGLTFGWKYSPVWTIVASPFLISFALGIPLTYLTGKQIKKWPRVNLALAAIN